MRICDPRSVHGSFAPAFGCLLFRLRCTLALVSFGSRIAFTAAFTDLTVGSFVLRIHAFTRTLRLVTRTHLTVLRAHPRFATSLFLPRLRLFLLCTARIWFIFTRCGSCTALTRCGLHAFLSAVCLTASFACTLCTRSPPGSGLTFLRFRSLALTSRITDLHLASFTFSRSSRSAHTHALFPLRSATHDPASHWMVWLRLRLRVHLTDTRHWIAFWIAVHWFVCLTFTGSLSRGLLMVRSGSLVFLAHSFTHTAFTLCVFASFVLLDPGSFIFLHVLPLWFALAFSVLWITVLDLPGSSRSARSSLFAFCTLHSFTWFAHLDRRTHARLFASLYTHHSPHSFRFADRFPHCCISSLVTRLRTLSRFTPHAPALPARFTFARTWFALLWICALDHAHISATARVRLSFVCAHLFCHLISLHGSSFGFLFSLDRTRTRFATFTLAHVYAHLTDPGYTGSAHALARSPGSVYARTLTGHGWISFSHPLVHSLCTGSPRFLSVCTLSDNFFSLDRISRPGSYSARAPGSRSPGSFCTLSHRLHSLAVTRMRSLHRGSFGSLDHSGSLDLVLTGSFVLPRIARSDLASRFALSGWIFLCLGSRISDRHRFARLHSVLLDRAHLFLFSFPG